MEEIRIEYEDFEVVKKWPRNPKDHDHHEIRKSFYRFGFINPVIVDEGSKKLVAGHGRIETLTILKDSGKEPPNRVKVEGDVWKIPVLRGVEFDNPAEAEAYLLADNRLTEIGGWDQDVLSEILSEIIDVDGALDGIGFDIAEAAALVDQHELTLDAETGESDNKGYRQYSALLTSEQYRFIIDTLVHLEKKQLSKEEYVEVNRKGYCLYKIVKEWSEVQGQDGVRESS